MSEHHHGTDEIAQETMTLNKYVTDTDAGEVNDANVPDMVISPAPDPDFAQGGDHAESETATEKVPDSAVVDQEVREV